MNKFIPTYHVSNLHKKRCQASPENAFKAIETLTIDQIPLTRKLLHLRTIILKIVKREFDKKLYVKHTHRNSNKPILDLKSNSSWIILNRIPNKEITIGAIGSFWKTSLEFVPISGINTFLNFKNNRYAKAILNFRIDKHKKFYVVILETKVYALDPISRKNLRFYWALIAPGMWLVRKMWLLGIKQKAEAFQVLGND